LIELVEQILILFKLTRAKDIFEEFYQRGLCRRLLLKKSASYDSERVMIMKLKTECGDVFINQVEGMLKDLSTSEQFMKEYLKVRGDDLAQKFENIEP
jgi:cullin 4